MKKIILSNCLILSCLFIFSKTVLAETIYACKTPSDALSAPGVLYQVGNTIPTCQPGHEIISWNQTGSGDGETIYACKVVGDPNFPGVLYQVGTAIPTCSPGHEVISWNEKAPLGQSGPQLKMVDCFDGSCGRAYRQIGTIIDMNAGLLGWPDFRPNERLNLVIPLTNPKGVVKHAPVMVDWWGAGDTVTPQVTSGEFYFFENDCSGIAHLAKSHMYPNSAKTFRLIDYDIRLQHLKDFNGGPTTGLKLWSAVNENVVIIGLTPLAIMQGGNCNPYNGGTIDLIEMEVVVEDLFAEFPKPWGLVLE